MDRSNITAGLPNEKVGMNEIPLFVAVIAPFKWLGVSVISDVWEDTIKESEKRRNASNDILARFFVIGLLLRGFHGIKKYGSG